jgi:hypothetical protein
MGTPLIRLGSALAVPLALLAAGCGKSAPPADPPQIVPWSSVGGVHLGDSAERVRRLYGPALRSQALRLPVGTRYAGHAARIESFQVPGGVISVTYVDGLVREIGTDSARYRLPTGIGVGTELSAGTCRHVEGNRCVYQWHGFRFDECGNAWVGDVGPADVEIVMSRGFLTRPRGRIRWIDFGDPDVVLYCF